MSSDCAAKTSGLAVKNFLFELVFGLLFYKEMGLFWGPFLVLSYCNSLLFGLFFHKFFQVIFKLFLGFWGPK